MSLHPEPIGEVPAETARVARAAFPKGTVVTRLRDEFSALFEDKEFRALYPARCQPSLTPWRLALVTVFQFLEHLSDRQAPSVPMTGSWPDGVDGPQRHRCAKMRVVRIGRKGAARNEHHHDRP